MRRFLFVGGVATIAMVILGCWYGSPSIRGFILNEFVVGYAQYDRMAPDAIWADIEKRAAVLSSVGETSESEVAFKNLLQVTASDAFANADLGMSGLGGYTPHGTPFRDSPRTHVAALGLFHGLKTLISRDGPEAVEFAAVHFNQTSGALADCIVLAAFLDSSLDQAGTEFWESTGSRWQEFATSKQPAAQMLALRFLPYWSKGENASLEPIVHGLESSITLMNFESFRAIGACMSRKIPLDQPGIVEALERFLSTPQAGKNDGTCIGPEGPPNPARAAEYALNLLRNGSE